MYPLFDLLLRHAAHRKPQRHLVKNHGLADHLVGILHHQADNLAPFLNGEAGDILSLQKNFPGVRRDEATDQIGKCALSRAVLSHNADHFPFFNSEIDILQNLLSRDVGEAYPLHLEHGLRPLSFRRQLCLLEPSLYPFSVRGKFHRFNMLRHRFRLHGTARMLQRRNIERFPDAFLFQHIRAEQLIRFHVSHDFSLAHNHDAVHVTVKGILQPVFDDEHRFSGGLADLIDQIDGPFSRRRVQVCQRLIEQQNIHIIDHDACHGHPLLLSAGKLRWRMIQKEFHIHGFRNLIHTLKQLFLGNAVILQRKSDVLRHRQTDELPVRILQHRSHQL